MSFRHPMHPVLAHLPVACWVMIPVCDLLGLVSSHPVFWQAGAVMAGFGVIGGALAATAGAIDLEKAQRAGRLGPGHAAVMSVALGLSMVGAWLRIPSGVTGSAAPSSYAVGAGLAALTLTVIGGWLGGEMVYGRGVAVGPCEGSE